MTLAYSHTVIAREFIECVGCRRWNLSSTARLLGYEKCFYCFYRFDKFIHQPNKHYGTNAGDNDACVFAAGLP